MDEIEEAFKHNSRRYDYLYSCFLAAENEAAYWEKTTKELERENKSLKSKISKLKIQKILQEPYNQ